MGKLLCLNLKKKEAAIQDNIFKISLDELRAEVKLLKGVNYVPTSA